MAAAAAAVVLDASAVLQLVLPDSAHRAQLVADLVQEIAAGHLVAHVPLIFFNEVAAGCAKGVRRVNADGTPRLRKADADTFLQQLEKLPLNVSVEVSTAAAWYARAVKLGCQVGDAAYVALAADLKATLATFDGGQATAARSQRVKIYFPST